MPVVRSGLLGVTVGTQRVQSAGLNGNVGDIVPVGSLVPQVIPAAGDVETEESLHRLAMGVAGQRQPVADAVPAVLS
jgi:hypothetical protein